MAALPELGLIIWDVSKGLIQQVAHVMTNLHQKNVKLNRKINCQLGLTVFEEGK